MTWSTPLTAVSNAALTAAQWNASVRDNLLETAPAKATTAGYHFVPTGTNAIAERAIVHAEVATSETTVSATYTDLATVGPSVTCTTGAQALVWIGCGISNSGAGNFGVAAVTLGGASSGGGGIDNAVTNTGTASNRASSCYYASSSTGLVAGSNSFKVQYRVSAGTGTFGSRAIAVMAL